MILNFDFLDSILTFHFYDFLLAFQSKPRTQFLLHLRKNLVDLLDFIFKLKDLLLPNYSLRVVAQATRFCSMLHQVILIDGQIGSGHAIGSWGKNPDAECWTKTRGHLLGLCFLDCD